MVELLTEIFFNGQSISTLKPFPLGSGKIGRRALYILGSSGSSVSYTIRVNNMGWERTLPIPPTTQEKMREFWRDYYIWGK